MTIDSEKWRRAVEFIMDEQPSRTTYYTRPQWIQLTQQEIEEDKARHFVVAVLRGASNGKAIASSAYQAVGKIEVKVGSWLRVEPHPLCPEGYLIPKEWVK